MVVAERNGLPVAIWAGSATLREVTLVDATLDSRFTAQQPQRIIGYIARIGPTAPTPFRSVSPLVKELPPFTRHQ